MSVIDLSAMCDVFAELVPPLLLRYCIFEVKTLLFLIALRVLISGTRDYFYRVRSVRYGYDTNSQLLGSEISNLNRSVISTEHVSNPLLHTA